MKPSIIIGALLALLLAANSMFVVSERELAVLFQFGAVQRTSFQPGLHFKIPLIQSVRKFDKRLLSVSSEPDRFLTSEKKDVYVDFYVKWRIADVSRFYTATMGDELGAAQRLGPIVRQAIGKAINERKLQEVVSGGRADMLRQILEATRKPATELGVEVVDVRIKRTDLPKEVSNSVYQRMAAERTRVASGLRAEGSQAAETIQADADRARQVILAEARADGERLRGEGEAEAARIYAQAYGKDAEFYGFWRSLQAYRQSFRSKDGVLVLDRDSEFFKYFGEGGDK